MAADALALLGLAAGGLALWRVDRLWQRVHASRQAVQERELALREREMALMEKRVQEPDEAMQLPTDLQLRVNAESQQWAREQMLSLVRQLYGKHKNWDAVRMEVQQLDAQAVMAEFGWSQVSGVS